PGGELATVDLGRRQAAQQRVVVQQYLVDAPIERFGVGEIADPDRAAPNLVLVGRADAAPGRADPPLAAALLAGTIARAVRRQDQRRIVSEEQVLWRNLQALCAHRLDLGDERPGVDDDPVADDRQLAAHHARG